LTILAYFRLLGFRHFLIEEVAQTLGYFFHGKSYKLNLKKMGWASRFWAIFSRTRLVTLKLTPKERNYVSIQKGGHFLPLNTFLTFWKLFVPEILFCDENSGQKKVMRLQSKDQQEPLPPTFHNRK
jgi:hypothetical protein